MPIPWTENSLIVTNKNWQMSQPIQGDFIRVTHEFLNVTSLEDVPYPWYGHIAQAEFNPFTLLNVRRLYPADNLGGQIFYFSDSVPISDRRIAVRGQRRWTTAIEWVVTIHTPTIPVQATLGIDPGQQVQLDATTIEAIAELIKAP